MDYNQYLLDLCNNINEHIDKCIDVYNGSVSDAMRYSLLSGGKRTRACLALSTAEMLHGNAEYAMRAACSIEMLHCYSLIHDDLPCMDDDDYRRGQLSCHKKYGYDIAVLAGDALLTQAFYHLSSISDPSVSSNCVRLLSKAAGYEGMILGQELDIKGVKRNENISFQLNLININKTGRLITTSILMGAVCSGITDGPIYDSLEKYGNNIGLVFQIVDDVLDVTSNLEVLGKKTFSDTNNQKITYCSEYGVEGAMQKATALTDECISFIAEIENSDFLKWFAINLLHRTK